MTSYGVTQVPVGQNVVTQGRPPLPTSPVNFQTLKPQSVTLPGYSTNQQSSQPESLRNTFGGNVQPPL